MDFYRYFRLITYAIDEGVLFALSDYTVYFSQFAHTFCVYIDIAPFFHTRYLHIDPARSFPQIAYTYTQSLRVKRLAYSYTQSTFFIPAFSTYTSKIYSHPHPF